MRASPTLPQRLWLPKTADAALVHINSLTLVLTVMKTVRHAGKEAIIAETWRLSRSRSPTFFSRCILSGQERGVVMLWSDKEHRPPSLYSDTA
jgi:hypothetical protein